MSELLADGTTAARSADKTLAATKSVILFLKDAAGPVVPLASCVHVQVKEGSEYFTLHTLTGQNPSARLEASSDVDLVFACYREACEASVGVGVSGTVA